MRQQTDSYTLLLKNETKPFVNNTRWALIILKLALIPFLAIFPLPYWWLLCIILFAISIFEYRAMKLIPAVQLSSDNIMFKGIVKKIYPWESFSNVLLKDGLLTIDFKDNRLFQKEIAGDVDERSFNEWCTEKLYKLKG